MKKILFSILVLAGITATAQVKVGTNPTSIDNASMLELEGTTKGFLPTRMTTAQRDAIASPPKGLVLYNTSVDCLQINKGTAASPNWECIGASAAPTATADCNASGFNGTYVSGTALSGQTYTVTVVNSSLSPVSIAMQSSDLVLSGVGGVAVGTVSPATLNVPAGGSEIVTYNLTGNPTSCGTLTGVWTKISLTCTKTVSVSQSNFSLPATSETYNTAGEVSAFTANWTAQAGATGYTVEHSTSSTGPWTAFPSNPYTGTSAAISGLSGNYAYWVRVTSIGSTCNGSTALSVVGCAVKVGPDSWKVFMCHDLGANVAANPHVPVQDIHGNYYQWGRSNIVANASTPAGAIGGWNTSSAGNGSWLDGGKTANDPCPTGFRVPTSTQLTNVINNNVVSRTGSWANDGNFTTAIHWGQNASTKNLTLPASGYRQEQAGALENRGANGVIWSSTENGAGATYLIFTSSVAVTGVANRAAGFTVRCIKE